MCGINGFVTKAKGIDVADQLNKMNNLILHRGPDQDGIFDFQGGFGSIGMGMRRLSIIDLKTGKQPIFNEDKSLVVVFNGEIYNYKELKLQLEGLGVNFITSSDTEVILKLYENFGTDSFSMLDGMFAFSIFDKNLNKVYIARDFFGEKPLYYSATESSIYWASELKSIVGIRETDFTISRVGLNLYFQLTYIPAPFTIYEEVKKLEANHFLEFNCLDFSFNINEIKQEFKHYEETTKEGLVKKTHDMVLESVKSRSISDVPLGTFLSGGVDSSIVSLCLAQASDRAIDTFSIGFEKKSFDETDKSNTVAKLLKSNHHEFIITEHILRENLSEILLNFDEPFADSSALASYVVANKTKKYVTVALTGDGGDEVFGGYNKYYMGTLNEKYTSIIPQKFHSSVSSFIQRMLVVKGDKRGFRFKANRLLNAINYEGDFYYNIISLGFQNSELTSLFKKKYLVSDPLAFFKETIGVENRSLKDFRAIDKIISLEGDMLVKVDRTSMLTSLECRAPFLNKELWNYTNSIPDKYLINGWDKKHILKEAFKQYFPERFLNKSKKGFGVPVGDWLRSGLKQELLSYVERGFVEKQNLFNFEYVANLVNNHVEGKIDNTFKIWTYFCFQKWYKNQHVI